MNHLDSARASATSFVVSVAAGSIALAMIPCYVWWPGSDLIPMASVMTLSAFCGPRATTWYFRAVNPTVLSGSAVFSLFAMFDLLTWDERWVRLLALLVMGLASAFVAGRREKSSPN